MFTPIIRFILLVICGLLAVLFAYMGSVPLIVLCSLFSIVLLWGYYKRGTVFLALSKLRKNDYVAAEKIIGLTVNPDKLSRSQKGYYYFIKAFVEREKDNYPEAESLFLRALAEGLKTGHDKAMSLLALADMEMIKGNKDMARDYLGQMKDLKVQPSLMPSIRRMQEWVGNV